MSRALALLVLAATLLAAPDAKADPVDRPRRNIRLAAAIGSGFVAPPLCGRCDRFWGRGLAVDIEIGWTIVPSLVLSLQQAGTVIYFSDGTDGSVASLGLSAAYFVRPRTWVRGGVGLAIVDVTEDEHPDPLAGRWEKFGTGLTLGIGHDFHRSGALSTHVEARAITGITGQSVNPSLLALLGISWN